MKREFKIDLKYFKPSGKFYSEGTYKGEFTDCGTKGHPSCYMTEVVDEINHKRRSGGPLPGLNGVWSSYILVDCEDGFPVLITPRS